MRVRRAELADVPELEALMRASVRSLLRPYLEPDVIEASFEIMGVDTELIRDGVYYVVEDEGRLVGCGGWSRRATLFGADYSNSRDSRMLDPETEPARIRAMYTHPDWARRGVGRLILAASEAAAAAEGFRTCELAATRAGEPLYRACGYEALDRFEWPTAGPPVPLLRMRKTLS